MFLLLGVSLLTVLQEAASLTIKELNGYGFGINLGICHMLNSIVALARLGTGWLMCGPTKQGRRVIADTVLEMNWLCEQDKLHAGLHCEECSHQIERD